MNKLSFYEQAGIVIPGAVLSFGVLFFIPEAKEFLTKEGVTVGGLGIYLIISYAAGHLVAAVGSVVEWLAWLISGGRPSTWLTKPEAKVASAEQQAQISTQVAARLGVASPRLPGMSKREWESIWWQLYTDVLNCSPGRIEIHNGNYGLNRGLSAAFIVLGLMLLLTLRNTFHALILVAIGIVFVIRMRRFGIHFVREVCNQFLLLPPRPGEKPPSGK